MLIVRFKKSQNQNLKKVVKIVSESIGIVCHKSESAKANGREPKSCLGRAFNFKLARFVMHRIPRHIQARPSLELKIKPRFRPVSSSLSMHKFNLAACLYQCDPISSERMKSVNDKSRSRKGDFCIARKDDKSIKTNTV
jgi:hypothetical protein